MRLSINIRVIIKSFSSFHNEILRWRSYRYRYYIILIDSCRLLIRRGISSLITQLSETVYSKEIIFIIIREIFQD